MLMQLSLSPLLVVLLATVTSSFTAPCRQDHHGVVSGHQTKMSAAKLMEDADDGPAARRAFLTQGGAFLVGSLLLPSTSFAAATGGGPVVVLGAAGKTGMEVVQALAKEGLPTVSMTRTGKNPYQVVKLPADVKAQITHYPEPVNVVSIDSLRQALTGIGSKPAGIIFCASASRQGGSATQVDGEGVANAAQIAKELGARFVLISALAVDRPASKSFQMTNTLGGNYNGIMDAKLEGENKVRSILKDYVIVRPGVLMAGKSKAGAADLELNQGDFVGGGLNREELAGVAVGAFQSGKKGVTVEVYRKSTRTKLQPDFDDKSGREQYGTSYAGLFDSVKAE